MYRYDVNENLKLIDAWFEGDVSDADLFNYLSQMLSHTKYGAGWSSLIDLSKATKISLTSGGVQRMRALPLYMEERLKGARAAVVAPEGSQALEMARMYEKMGFSSAYEVRVFTDRNAAMKWLYE